MFLKSNLNTLEIYRNYIFLNNIIKGYSDGSFLTEQKINRAELLKILLEGNNIELLEITEDCFYDVSIEEWYGTYICNAKEYGFIQGYQDKTFKPEQTVNKAEALKMIGQVYYWGIEEIEGDLWYLPYATYAENKNLIPEIEILNEYYSDLNRGIVSEIIYRLLVSNSLKIEKFNLEAENQIYSGLEMQKFPLNYQNIKIILKWENIQEEEENEKDQENLKIKKDFDVYLITPDGEEINFRRKISTDYQIIYEEIDQKETINISKLIDGNYELFIQSNNGFQDSEVSIEIYENNNLSYTYSSNESEAKVWKLLHILDMSEILLIDQYGDCNLIQKENTYCN